MKNTKKMLIPMIIGMVIFAASISYADVSKGEARNIVINQILANDIQYVNVYQEPVIFSGNSYAINPYKSISALYSANWIFFVDDHPFAEWFHECRYIFLDANSGNYTVIDETFPPLNFKNMLEEVSINVVMEEPDFEPGQKTEIEGVRSDPHKYAVFISGETERRHWDNMSAMYCALKEVYGYTDENIYVLSHDGEQGDEEYGNWYLDLDQQGDPNDIDGPATYSEIQSTFSWLENNLNEDDMLFVYITAHGGYDPSQYNSSFIGLYEDYIMWDHQLAVMVNPINCAQKIIMTNTCHGGGLGDDLAGSHVTFHAATDWEHSAWSGYNWAYKFSEWSFYWAAAARGFYCHYTHPWVASFPVGSHPYIPHDYDPDVDEDGFVQMGEAFDWADYMDAWTTTGFYIEAYSGGELVIEYPNYEEDIGFQEDLLSLYGLCGNVANSQTVTGNFLVNPALTIGPEVTLAIMDNSNIYIGPEVTLTVDNNSYLYVNNDASLYLFGRSLIEVINASEFKLQHRAKLYGTEHKIWMDNNTGERYNTWEEMHEAVPNHNGNIIEVPGDRVIVRDGGSFGTLGYYDNHVTISAIGENRWDGIILKNTSGYGEVEACDISKISSIKLEDAALTLAHSSFSDCGQIIARNDSYLEIYLSTINNNSKCPVITFDSQTYINDSYFINNNGIGIAVYYGIGYFQRIDTNIISGNDWGVLCYDSPMHVYYNQIVNSTSHGFVSYGGTSRAILDGNLIQNNGDAELIAAHQCFPDFLYSTTIIDNDGYEPESFDQYLLMCGQHIEGEQHDCHDLTIDISDESRFFPNIDAFYFGGEKPPEKVTYEEGIAEITDEDYESAKLTMKDIVDNYPETETAEDALQWLMYLEKFSGHDYAGLRDYIETIDEISYPHLERVKYNTTTSTYMAEADYETAIVRLETILANPPSVEDSIFAYIDEGYCYLKLDEQGGKAAVEECTFKPRCFEEFVYVSQNLTRNLLDKAIPHPEPSIPEIKTFALYQNYPNPCAHNTTISYALPKSGKVSLKIYNIKGQLVRTIVDEYREKGHYAEIWDGKDENGKPVSSGIYFYKLETDNSKSQIKKMLLIR